jgi:cbb3-type cytochrome oxidase subunit 3
MRLSDIMSAANLSAYAEVALVIFCLAFVAIVVRTWAPSRRAELEAAARIPLDDDAPSGGR